MNTTNINLGKKLNVGDLFRSTTKRQSKAPIEGMGWKAVLKVKRVGWEGYFQHGKRKYYGRIVRILETRIGVYYASICPTTYKGGNRYWMFTYLVKVIEN